MLQFKNSLDVLYVYLYQVFEWSLYMYCALFSTPVLCLFLYKHNLPFHISFFAFKYLNWYLETFIRSLLDFFCSPCFVFNNPLLYESVTVKESTKIDANHLIVVYKRLKESDVQRRVVQGPTVFVPEAEEWLVFMFTIYFFFSHLWSIVLPDRFIGMLGFFYASSKPEIYMYKITLLTVYQQFLP